MEELDKMSEELLASFYPDGKKPTLKELLKKGDEILKEVKSHNATREWCKHTECSYDDYKNSFTCNHCGMATKNYLK